MARKREKKKSDMEIFSFGIDRNDPRYAQLLHYLLEDIESGSRSFVIRQVLNNYVLGQSSAGTVGLLPPQPAVVPTPVQEPVVSQPIVEPVIQTTVEKIPEAKEEPVVVKETQPEPVKQTEDTEEVVPKSPVIPPSKQEDVVNEFVQEKQVKIKKNNKLKNLANTFQ